MEKYNEIRWNRVIELNFPLESVKSIIKKDYNYELKESSLQEVVNNIGQYNKIKQGDLLNNIEKYLYNKVSIFYCKRYKKNKDEPLFQDLSNEIFEECFKKKNRINMSNGQYYTGELGSCFKTTYYNKVKANFIIIKMAKVVESEVNEENDNGEIEEYTKEYYDCAKFIIDLSKRIVLMFYNDFIGVNSTYEKEITAKKNSFRNLFTDVSNRNLLKYNIDKTLEKYFNEYMCEIKNNEPRKLISIIETMKPGGERSSLKSVQYDYNHDSKRLEAIEDEVNNKGYTISIIECIVNGDSININNLGEIICQTSFFYKEVVKNVCEEFFDGYELSTYI